MAAARVYNAGGIPHKGNCLERLQKSQKGEVNHHPRFIFKKKTTESLRKRKTKEEKTLEEGEQDSTLGIKVELIVGEAEGGPNQSLQSFFSYIAP